MSGASLPFRVLLRGHTVNYQSAIKDGDILEHGEMLTVHFFIEKNHLQNDINENKIPFCRNMCVYICLYDNRLAKDTYVNSYKSYIA